MTRQIESAIKSTRLGRGLWRLVVNLDHHHAGSVANSMAFDAFLSVIPLIALAGWVLARLHESGDSVLRSLFNAAPHPIQQLAGAEFLRLSEGGSAAVPPISLIAFTWVTSSGMSTAIGEFEVIFHAAPRGYWARRAIAVGCVLASIVIYALVTAGTIFLATNSGPYGARVIAFTVPALVSIGGLTTFFRIAVRRPKTTRRRLFPGAFVTVALWTVLSLVFSLYVTRLARYVTLYGSLATVAILLFWLWLLSLALLVGGEVNAQLEGIRDDRGASPTGDGPEKAVPPG